MDKSLIISSSPHIVKKTNTRVIMRDVVIALVPAVVAATVVFGYLTLVNCFVCAAACFGFEMLYDVLFKKKKARESTAWDLSCVVTGLILALNLPTTLNIWGLNIMSGDYIAFSFDTLIACVIGSLFAVWIIKMLFGGIGKNIFNPACAARVFLFLAFSSAFLPVFKTDIWGFNTTTGATWLGMEDLVANNVGKKTFIDMFLGGVGSAAVGETSAIAIAIGYIYLSVRKVIDFRIPIIVVGTTMVFGALFSLAFVRIETAPEVYRMLTAKELLKNFIGQGLSGGILFASVYMATDYSTSPDTFWGSAIFAFGIGLLTALIRVFGSYPEGASFAIILMNILTPLIDKYVRLRPFGYRKEKANRSVRKPDEEAGAAGTTKAEVK